MYWKCQGDDGTFSQALGGSSTKIAISQCILERLCSYQLNCDEVGSYSASTLGSEVLGEVWGLLALNSLININQQLPNQYITIKEALGILALDTFSIGDFFPSPDGCFNIVNALTGLGTILAVVSGFVPFLSPGLAATGAILPAVGTLLGNAAASKGDQMVGQKEFAPKLRQLYTNYVKALDIVGKELFKGSAFQTANRAFNITDMMMNGSWADTSARTRLTDLETILTVEILSRSIGAL